MENKVFIVPQPKAHKAKVCIWDYLTLSDLDSLDACSGNEEKKLMLARIFAIDDQAENLKSAILLDLYFHLLKFAESNSFSKEQTSSLFSIVIRVHQVCTETPFGNVDLCFGYFKELLLRHSVRRPPHSIDLFNPDQTSKIAHYVVNSYFRHYNLYKYAYTPAVRVNLHFTYNGAPVTSKEDEMVTDLEIPVPEQPGQQADDADQLPAAQPLPTASANQDETQRGTETLSRSSGAPIQAEGTDRSGFTQRSAEQAPSEAQTTVDSESIKLLRELIKTQLSEEIKRVRGGLEESLKRTEDTFNKKLQSVEAAQAASQLQAGKSGSGKGRKK